MDEGSIHMYEGETFHVTSLQRITPYHRHKGGASADFGALSCSFYRFRFQSSLSDSLSALTYWPHIRAPEDVLMSGIAYMVVSGSPRKKPKFISQGSTTMQSLGSKLTIYCEDFSVHYYTFFPESLNKKDSLKELTSFMTHLISAAFPTDHMHLWSKSTVPFVYKDLNIPVPPNKPDSPRKNMIQFILQNLLMSKRGKFSRICFLNRNFRFEVKTEANSLPPFFLVPELLQDNTIKIFFPMFENCRGPVVCCSIPPIIDNSNGKFIRMPALLMRSAMPLPDMKRDCYKCFVKNVIDSIKSHDPHHQVLPFDLDKNLPTLVEVGEARARLRALCQPASERDFLTKDKRWYEEVFKTNWLNIVSQVLKVVQNVIYHLQNNHSIILQETGGRDWSCVIASLVQICLFPKCRTRDGFQEVIDREWVLAGHDNPLRSGHYRPVDKKSGKKKKLPKMGSASSLGSHLSGAAETALSNAGLAGETGGVFTSGPPCLMALFVDCVFQLVSQYPTEFEMSVDYLVFLLDASFMPNLVEFSFATEFDRDCIELCYLASTPGSSPAFYSLWDWNNLLTPETVALFNNPRFQLIHHHFARPKTRNPLVPLWQPARVQFWRHAYLRYLQFCGIKDGGEANTVLQYRMLHNYLEDYEESLKMAKVVPEIPVNGLQNNSNNMREHNYTQKIRAVTCTDGKPGARTMKRCTISSGFPFVNISMDVDEQDRFSCDGTSTTDSSMELRSTFGSQQQASSDSSVEESSDVDN